MVLGIIIQWIPLYRIGVDPNKHFLILKHPYSSESLMQRTGADYFEKRSIRLRKKIPVGSRFTELSVYKDLPEEFKKIPCLEASGYAMSITPCAKNSWESVNPQVLKGSASLSQGDVAIHEAA